MGRTVKSVNGHLAGVCQMCGFLPGERGYLRLGAAVGQPDFGHIVPCPVCNQQKLAQAKAETSQLQGWLARASFETYVDSQGNQPGLRAAMNFAARPCGWLTLWGGYGRGKTHLLAAIANACQAQGSPALYYTLPDWLDQVRTGYERPGAASDLVAFCSLVKVLLLDEVDKANLTDWAVEKLYQLVDARYRRLEELGTVFALNLDPVQSLSSGVNAPIHYLFSRMCDERSRLVSLEGPDGRPITKQLAKGVKK